MKTIKYKIILDESRIWGGRKKENLEIQDKLKASNFSTINIGEINGLKGISGLYIISKE